MACVDLLTLESTDDTNALSITYTQSPCDRLALCEQYAESRPAEAAIINIDVNTRSATSVADDESGEIPTELRIDHVSSPTDLTGLGIKITNQLDTWDTEVPSRQIVACFHSVTTLLQYIDLRRSFKFLNILTTRFTNADAIAHYHMDLSAHDEQTISQLSHLFDAILEYENQEWSVRTR